MKRVRDEKLIEDVAAYLWVKLDDSDLDHWSQVPEDMKNKYRDSVIALLVK
jgi:hypothetical protein